MTDKYRPPVEERTHRDRTEPARIKVRTKWLYSEREDVILQPGESRHAFARGGHVVESDTFKVGIVQGVSDHVYRAIELFGDDVDLIIEVRRA